ncbi:MAG: TIGR03086 family metal-binding protein [Frankia sp.]
MTDILGLDHRALKITEAIVNRVDVGMLHRPTPCAEWTLGQLLAHMVGQNHGFAAAARGETSDLTVWADRPVGDDPGGVFAESAATATAAFIEDGVLEREWWLPEIRGGQLFPARQAISFHLVDYVVHGWDVAAAIAVRTAFDADLLDAVLPIARQVPGGASRQREDAQFQPGEDAVAGGSTLDRILAMLGRSPNWPD